MAKKCIISKKKISFGNKVSHSKIKSKKKFKPNVFLKKIKLPNKTEIKFKVSSSILRTIKKIGIYNTCIKYIKK